MTLTIQTHSRSVATFKTPQDVTDRMQSCNKISFRLYLNACRTWQQKQGVFLSETSERVAEARGKKKLFETVFKFSQVKAEKAVGK
jgi:hypothetical protein